MRAFVKLSYVAGEFAVGKANGVLFGDISVVTVAVEFLRHNVDIVGLDDNGASFAHLSFHGVLNDDFRFTHDESHFVMYALENRGDDYAVYLSFPFVNEEHVLRADDDVHFFVEREVVNAVENLVDEADFGFADHRAGENVAFADEVRYERVFGFVVNVFRRAYLLNRSVLHNDDSVAHRQGFFLIVRNVNERYAEFFVHLFKFELHVFSHFEVERAERLVQKKNLGFVDDRSRDGYSLLLTARKSGYVPLFELFEVYEFENSRNLRVDYVFGEFFGFRYDFSVARFIGVSEFFEFQPERYVIVNVEVREERVTLKNRVYRSFVRRNVRYVLAVEQNLALVGHFESCDHTERGRFSATRGT